jgi:hypothetical protein
MGYSIGKVFRPIEEEMRKYAKVDALYLPIPNYSLMGLWKNIKATRTAIKNKQYDVIHITGTENYLIPFLRGTKVVVTVHDIRFFSEDWSCIRTFLKYILFVRTLKFANIVTFISEKGQKDTYSMLDLGNKGVVIDNPIGNEYKHHKKKCNFKCPAILHIGTKPNKNLDRTIEALKGFNCTLRIVGDVDADTIQRMNANHIDYTIVKNLSDKQIVEEYEKCDIVNFPSLEEGFGMPIIEGQAIGRLVVTSNRLPMSEIAGNGAIIVDPESIESIRHGYETAVEEYDKIVQNGIDNVKRFKLDIITKKYYRIYKSII